MTASGENPPSEGKVKAFDGTTNTKWYAPGITGWIQYQLTAPLIVTQYKISSANDSPGRDPRDWTLKGSNDGQIGLHWIREQAKRLRRDTRRIPIPSAIARLTFTIGWMCQPIMGLGNCSYLRLDFSEHQHHYQPFNGTSFGSVTVQLVNMTELRLGWTNRLLDLLG